MSSTSDKGKGKKRKRGKLTTTRSVQPETAAGWTDLGHSDGIQLTPRTYDEFEIEIKDWSGSKVTRPSIVAGSVSGSWSKIALSSTPSPPLPAVTPTIVAPSWGASRVTTPSWGYSEQELVDQLVDRALSAAFNETDDPAKMLRASARVLDQVETLVNQRRNDSITDEQRSTLIHAVRWLRALADFMENHPSISAIVCPEGIGRNT